MTIIHILQCHDTELGPRGHTHLNDDYCCLLSLHPICSCLAQSFAYTGFVFLMPAVNESVTSAVLQYAAFHTETYLKPRNEDSQHINNKQSTMKSKRHSPSCTE